MKNLILLTLTWNFALSLNSRESCQIRHRNGENTLDLQCDQENNERIHTIKDIEASCGLKDDVLKENIKTIEIKGCTFDKFNLFTNCTSLYLSHVNAIKSIRRETFNGMNQLEYIELTHSNTELLASVFSELPNLRHVEIADNNLNLSALAFQGAHQLKFLSLDDSSMSSRSSGFFRDLNNLEYLGLQTHELSNLSSIDFTGLEIVKCLVLYQGQILNITGNWPHIMTNLGYLILSSNRIQDIDSMTLSQMHKLIVLDLEQNHIEQLNASTFSGLTNLRTINLRRNHINRIDNGAFSPLQNLKKLDLSYNRLTDLHEFTFKGLDNLQYLRLKANNISTINVNTFSALTKLIQLDLSSQDGLITIDLNAFPQFIDLQTKTVICNAINLEPTDFEKEEVQWFKAVMSYSNRADKISGFESECFQRFKIYQVHDQPTDLHNLTQRIADRSVIFGNLHLSDNQVNLINFD